MSDEDTGEMYEQVGTEWVLSTDDKSFKKSETATKNITNLIDQLSVAGKVAGSVLGKVWDGLQKTVSMGLKEFGDLTTGVTLNIAPEDLNFFTAVIRSINGTKKDALSVLSAVDDLIYRLNNKAPDSGARTKEFYKSLATAGVEQVDIDKLVKLAENKDNLGIQKFFADLAPKFGDKFSNIMNDQGLGIYGNLESEEQLKDFMDKWLTRGDDIYKVNMKGLDAAADGVADLKTALDLVSQTITSELGGLIEEFGSAVLEITGVLNTMIKGFKDNPWYQEKEASLKEWFIPDVDVFKGEKSRFEDLKEKWSALLDLTSPTKEQAKDLESKIEEVRNSSENEGGFLNNLLDVMLANISNKMDKESETGNLNNLEEPKDKNWLNPLSGIFKAMSEGNKNTSYKFQDFVGYKSQERLKAKTEEDMKHGIAVNQGHAGKDLSGGTAYAGKGDFYINTVTVNAEGIEELKRELISKVDLNSLTSSQWGSYKQ